MPKNLLNDLKAKKLILRGSGLEAEMFYEQWSTYLNFIRKYLDNSYNNIEYVIDIDSKKHGKYFHDLKIEKNIEQYEKDIFFVVGVYNNESIFSELEKLGYKKLCDFEYQFLFLKKFRGALSEQIINILLDNNIINENDLLCFNDNILNIGSEVYKKIEQSHIEIEDKQLVLELFLENILRQWLKFENKNKQISDLINYFSLSGIISGLYMVLGNYIKILEPFYENCISNDKNIKEIRTIGIFVPVYSNGGVQRVLSMLIPMFLELGLNIILFTNLKEEGEYDLPKNVKRVVLNNLIPFNFKKRLETYQNCIKEFNIDAFILNCYCDDISYFYEALFFKMLKIPVISEIHNTFMRFVRPETSDLQISEQYYKIMDKVITLSRTDKIFWETLSCNTKYIPNPIENGKKIWNLPINFKKRNGKTILWIGRTSAPIKRIFDTIPIMEEVRKKIPDAVLKIVGKTDGIEHFCKNVKEKSLENNIKFMGYHTDVDKFCEEADVLLMTSEYEGFPMVMTESKMRGVPIVMYEIPYIEMTRDLRGISEVPQRDTKAAAAAIIKILSDDKLRHRMSVESKQSLYPFIFYDIKTAWQEVFDDLLSSSDFK